MNEHAAAGLANALGPSIEQSHDFASPRDSYTSSRSLKGQSEARARDGIAVQRSIPHCDSLLEHL